MKTKIDKWYLTDTGIRLHLYKKTVNFIARNGVRISHCGQQLNLNRTMKENAVFGESDHPICKRCARNAQ